LFDGFVAQFIASVESTSTEEPFETRTSKLLAEPETLTNDQFTLLALEFIIKTLGLPVVVTPLIISPPKPVIGHLDNITVVSQSMFHISQEVVSTDVFLILFTFSIRTVRAHVNGLFSIMFQPLNSIVPIFSITASMFVAKAVPVTILDPKLSLSTLIFLMKNCAQESILP